ncbi:MAG: hypothetical protein RIQ89_2257 [Bacteroidota bacterium]|jgi:arginase family enzyme
MFDFQNYFEPLSDEVAKAPYHPKAIGAVIDKYTISYQIPSVDTAQLVIIGVLEERGAINNNGCAYGADEVRKKLYALRSAKYDYQIVDLGNLKNGNTLNDTYAALSSVMFELLKQGAIPIVIGGSHDLTYAMYTAYQKLEESINMVTVDAHFDLGSTEDTINASTFLGKIILHEPSFLFNYSNVGYQTYFVGADAIELMNKLYFETYRLGLVQRDMEEVEPIVRNADVVSIDISAIRQSDAPGNANASPNGFYGEEACAIARYAGLSDKLSSIGFFEFNPAYDHLNQTAHLIAQMVWYFIEGFYQRKRELPVGDHSAFLKYHVNMESDNHEIVFYKSKKSDRWWMEVPYPSEKVKYHRHHLVPCSYKDYEVAMRNELPERWWQALQKLS